MLKNKCEFIAPMDGVFSGRRKTSAARAAVLLLLTALIAETGIAPQCDAAPTDANKTTRRATRKSVSTVSARDRQTALKCHKAAQEAFKQYQADLKEGFGRHPHDVLDPGREAHRLDPSNAVYSKALVQYLLTVGEFQNKEDGPEIASETFKEVLQIEPGNATATKFLNDAKAKPAK